MSQFAEGFLWADSEWLEYGHEGLTYWQNRLAQQITCDFNEDGTVKWRGITRVVSDVGDEHLALCLCDGLNSWTGSWSMVYEPESRSIFGLSAMCAPLEWNVFLIRFSESLRLTAWFCDGVAQSLADAIDGTPAFSKPDGQPGLRVQPDGQNFYVEVLRSRPEWVMDTTIFRFPPVAAVADAFCGPLNADPTTVELGDLDFTIPLGEPLEGVGEMLLRAGFTRSELLGWGYTSSVEIPMASPVTASSLNDLALRQFLGSHSSLLGAWGRGGIGVRFRQFTMTSELLSYDKANAYSQRPPEELWPITSSLINAIDAFSEGGMAGENSAQGGQSAPGCDSVIQNIMSMFFQPAWDALDENVVDQSEPEGRQSADRRLLWLPEQPVLATFGWFNPIGPTVNSIVAAESGEREWALVSLMRHPLFPEYQVLASSHTLSDVAQSLGVHLLNVMPSLPSFIDLSVCPPDLRETVETVIINHARTLCQEEGVDLADETANARRFRTDPWGEASRGFDEAGDSTLANIGVSNSSPSDSELREWLRARTDESLVYTHWLALPSAWDGAINYQLQNGNIRGCDAGPFLVTYSEMGLMPTGEVGEVGERRET